jgi:transposase
LQADSQLIAELRKILDDAHRRLSPKSVMALAIAYGTKRWSALTHFLNNGSLEIDNNIADVIAKIAGDWPASRWDELMPWKWRPLTNTPNAQAA